MQDRPLEQSLSFPQKREKEVRQEQKTARSITPKFKLSIES